MFKIEFSYDVMADTPKNRNKIDGIDVYCGYHCYQSCHCPNGRICKYRKNFYRFYNMKAMIRRFFEYRLHIKLPRSLICICKYTTDLSGTTTCPFKEPRMYSCFDCKFCDGVDENFDILCLNNKVKELMKEGKYIETRIPGKDYCKFFDKNEYADEYNKKTGGILPADDKSQGD